MGLLKGTGLVSVIFVALLAVSTTARALDAPPVLQERAITATPEWETMPRLGNDGSSDIVVYTSRILLPDGAMGPGDIYHQRLGEDGAPLGAPVPVAAGSTDDELDDIGGDFIVYTAYDSTSTLSGRIMVHQISTGQVFAIGSALIMMEARISGTKVVWREGGSAANQVMLYDLSWLETARDADVIAGPVPPTFNVEIGDRFVVWVELTNGQKDLLAYDLSTGARLQVTNTPDVIESYPSTSGAWVVWQAQDRGMEESRIVARNMDTGEERTIVDDGHFNFRPSLDGDIIAYEGMLNGNLDVFIYRISTGETFQVTADPADQYFSDVFGNRVAYVDQRTGNEDLYLAVFGFEGLSKSSCTFIPGIVGCYPFDGDADDWSGNARHGVRHGGTFVADKFGNAGGALALNGVDVYVSVTNRAFDLSEFTIAAIVKVPDYAQDNWILSKGANFGNYCLMVDGQEDPWAGFASYVHQAAGPSGNWSMGVSNSPVPLNAFFHVAVTIGATEYRAYVNGRLTYTVANPPPPLINTSDLAIGAGGYYALSSFFSGAIDDLRIYNRPLTGSEIGLLYNRTFNSPPVAEAGPDQAIVTVDSRVTLDGRRSYDEDGDVLDYSWRFTEVPPGSAATLDDALSPQPAFVADLHGTYVLELTVNDPWATSAPDTVTISFDNLKPVAMAGGNQSVRVLDTVVLDGGGSYDPNGDSLAFAWSLITKPTGSAATLLNPASPIATFVADRPGTYEAQLVVQDGLSSSDPDTALITATLTANDLTGTLDDAVAAINGLGPASLRNPNLADALTNKIAAALEMIDRGDYTDALDKLQNDILGKTDGCALAGAPDKNDWILTCEAQARVYPLIVQAIDFLKLL